MSTLHRWRQLQAEEADGGPRRRPYLAEKCHTLGEAEKWRRQIIGEISNLVLLIQNTELDEAKIRDMNDHINKLFREKRHWERRIIDLGGPNYIRAADSQFDSHEAPGSRNYRYFGAAKDLPGIKELFAKPSKSIQKKTKAELLKDINCDYFGYRDEDDGVIIPQEREAEVKARQALITGSRLEACLIKSLN